MEDPSIRSIIFDLDDTLIQTSQLYNQSRKAFATVMLDYGFSGEAVLDKLDEIDIAHITSQGFAKERYPKSLVKTYHYYIQQAGQKVDPEIEKKISDIGWNVFNKIPPNVNDAEFVLEKLQKRYQLILATLGDPEIQYQKLAGSGLRPYFSSVYVLGYKSPEEYRHIIQEQNLDRKETWLIGNSVRSDLNPGLKLGLNCILIPAETWKFEEEHPVSNQYIEVNALIKVLDYL